ncbi:unnamed protein product [Ambrosiozyma monospora]|uniref:Unnamed protein product n=1 Tax=Ambrosiozyma monospora TaxID=43982 RepID=A0ACB5UAD9_AMBMO|nr:unnamed protein product [Ambrosiozyma monospora]
MISQLRDEFKVEIPVFLEEIYFPVSEMKTSTAHQKRYLLSIIHRLTNDPKAIVETYLNYDCEQSMPNICEKIMDYLDRLALTRADATPPQKVNYRESLTRSFATYPLNTFPQLNVSKLGGHPPDPDASLNFPIDYGLKMGSIDCIVSFLKSLSLWSGKPLSSGSGTVSRDESIVGSNGTLSSIKRGNRSASIGSFGVLQNNMSPDVSTTSLSALADGTEDNSQFDTIKQRKTAFLESMISQRVLPNFC